MKKIFFFFLLLSAHMQAQNVQWAYRLLESSLPPYKSREYSPTQVLGKPNSFPEGQPNIHSWQPNGNLIPLQFVKVGFLTPIKPKQIIIVESLNPGRITKITAFDADGKEYDVTSYTPKAIKATNRVLQVNTPNLNFYVLAVKVTLMVDKGVTAGIDAIGISSTEAPYQLKEDTSRFAKSNLVAAKLDSNVNSKYIELGPLVSPDGKTLYFSRRGDPDDKGGKMDKEDIWYSQWDENKKNWGPSKNMGEPLNNKHPNFVNSISPDGNTIVLGNAYLGDGDMTDGVSISRRMPDGKWSYPQRLIIEDDDENISLRANYYLSNSQKILLISNDRKGDSYGRRDLYVSFYKNDSTWTKPLNLGKTINTNGDEAAPFLAADEKTLYFSTDGLEGYGGSDIYITRRLDSTWTKWSTPENLGPVINSSYDESFFTITASGNQVYFTSESKQEENADIYTIVLPKELKPYPVMLIRGTVLNSKTNEKIPDVKIFFEDLSTGLEAGIAHSSPSTGQYQIVLPSGKNYGYLAQKEGFASVSSNIDLSSMPEYKEYQRDLYLTPIEVGQTVAINNIFFDFDKSDLRKESYPELKRIVKMLQTSPTMKIEISGNTDSVGTTKYNEALSQRRAESVFKYLTAQPGVNKKQIVMKYYGETKPIASNATAEGRQLNRRVQFKILSK
ncbi:MAG TPA: OmpA family protein [Cytophagaceae bacterium]|jgi:outer membrane protein OmpA-like peptidoglycan-associated protein|nr:OmpA family protein [Cytophagaceae bacterium]